MDIKKLINLVARSAVYIQQGCEGIRIDYYDTLDEIDENDLPEDELGFYGTGEESGEQYKIQYSDINLAEDVFYELKLVDIVEA
jgi:hypothetical protein